MSDRQILVEIIGDASSIERAMARSSTSLESFGKSATKAGKTLSRDVTLPLVAAGIASVKMAQNFDLLISRMVGLGGVSEAQSKKFRQFILDLAPKVGKGPDELANGLYQIVSAGVTGQRALEALTVSAKASAAGLGDTATVADAVTSAMNAYAKSGLTAKKAADVLSAAVRDGKGEAASFAPVLGKVVAVAAQLGVPFEQAAAALAQMTKLGVPADDAATQLSATFSSLLKTTPRAEKALEAMGLSAAGLRQELREKGLLATLQTLNEKTHGSTVAMAEAFPNVRALRGVLQLVGTAASGTAQTFKDVKDSTNSLGTAFSAVSKTDAFKMKQDLADLKVAAISLGETLAPVAKEVAGDISKLAKAFNDLSPAEKSVLVHLAEFAAVTGPLVLMTGKMITATSQIAKMAKALRGLAAAEEAASLGILGPAGLIAAGAALEAFAIYKAVTTANPTKVGTTDSGTNVVSASGKLYVQSPGGGRLTQLPPGSKWTPTAGPGGADRSNHPGVQGAGGGMMWSGDHAGLDGGFKSKLAACVEDAGGTQISVTSGRRSAAHNASVGGASNSNHLTGHAADGTCVINGVAYPLGNAPLNYSKFGLRAGSTFNWGGGPDIYHVDDGTNVGGAGGGGGGSTYDPLASTKAPKAPPWKGATQATIINAQGSVAAMLKGIPKTLDPVEQNAVSHIDALKKKLVPHMTAADLATTEVELRKWGKKLHDEISKNAKVAAAAAADAKKQFDRALSLDVSHILRDFDRQFAAAKSKYDHATAAGLAGLAAPSQTPEEKAFADFVAQRAAADQAKSRADQLAGAATPEEAAALSLGFSLDDQQAALEASATASRAAADKKATDDQQAYQDQRDAAWQHLQDVNDDQRTALQNNLDDWTAWLDAKKQSWGDFVAWLQANGIDTGGLIVPGGGILGMPGASGGPSNTLINPAVVPKGGSASVAAGGQTLVVEVPLNLDGNEVARVVTPHIPLQVRINL